MSSTINRQLARVYNQDWDVHAVHVLYRENGTWYHHLKAFPGALFDANGYLRFETEHEYKNCKYLQLGKQLSIPGGIASVPGYVPMRPEEKPATDIQEPEAPERVRYTVSRVVRDSPLVRDIKALHRNRCQLCEQVIALYGGQTYAEAHHIKPLGAKHNGPDVAANILCVCPNCHAQLDYGAIPIRLSCLRVVQGHRVGEEYVEYHNWFIYKGAVPKL